MWLAKINAKIFYVIIMITLLTLLCSCFRSYCTFGSISFNSDLDHCRDRVPHKRVDIHGDFWVLYNFLTATRIFEYFESVTYTTHADFTYMDNLGPLVERWRGPISVAIYAPGTDFNQSLRAIRYAQDCLSPLVKEYVTFHIYFDIKYFPEEIPTTEEVMALITDCSSAAPWREVSTSDTFKHNKDIPYPINVGRNIARGEATTYYVFASDIELYPSPGFIVDFLSMIESLRSKKSAAVPAVYVLPVFEIADKCEIPNTKLELIKLLENGSVIPFHKHICLPCHEVPEARVWINTKVNAGLHIFHKAKRQGKFRSWEPFFVGTDYEPLYDERLSWDGMSDKMSQVYAMCLLDYDFAVLDNAFLVHKRGIRRWKKDPRRVKYIWNTNNLLPQVYNELRIIYGNRSQCD